MKAIDIYTELRTKEINDWDILDIIETEYHNQNFNSELLEDFPFPAEYLEVESLGNNKENFNWQAGISDEDKRIYKYMQSIDFEFSNTTTQYY